MRRQTWPSTRRSASEYKVSIWYSLFEPGFARGSSGRAAGPAHVTRRASQAPSSVYCAFQIRLRLEYARVFLWAPPLLDSPLPVQSSPADIDCCCRRPEMSSSSSSRPQSPFKRLSRPSSRSSHSRDPSPSRSAWRSSRLGVPGAGNGAGVGAGGGGGVGGISVASDDRQEGSSSSWARATTSRAQGTTPAVPAYAGGLSRAEHYDVVLEGPTDADNGAGGAGDASAILPHLGFLVLDQTGTIDEADPHRSSFDSYSDVPRSGSGSSINAIRSIEMEAAYSPVLGSGPSEEKFEAMLQELLYTEKSYVKRVEALYRKYAVPLRQLAKDKDTAIMPLYEAQRLFGNIGEIVGANTAFLRDLESYAESRERERRGSGRISTGNLGEIVYRNMACFSCYSEYFGNFEKAKHIEQTMNRSNKAFRDFVDRIKYSTPDMGNIGIRELIMEPVQRIPRYTLLLDGLVRNLPKSDSNRPRLEEAAVLAGRIASCEVDDKTKRAAVLWSFKRNVEGFPPSLISVHRQFIDCIDVDDFPIDVLGPMAMAAGASSPSPALLSPSGQQTYRTIHCTLFLFDDVIAIAKRAGSSSSGRSAVGLDDLNKLADQMKTFTERSGPVPSSRDAGRPSKIELGFRGCIDVANVQALDLGGPDFQLTMAKGPSNVSGDKWANRLVRQYATIDSSNQTDPSQARLEKYRFLENLWRAQALLKTKDARSHVRCMVLPPSADGESEERARRIVYWNVYQRRAYLAEPCKNLAVLQVDPGREADRVPLGAENLPPLVCMRVTDIDRDAGTLLYTTSIKSLAEDDIDGEELTLPLSDISSQLRKLSGEARRAMSDFDPPLARRPGGSPSTPSSHRGRVVSGLEQFGRSLFSAANAGSIRSNHNGGDVFGLASPHRRTKSTASKASAATATTTSSSTPSRAASSGARTYSTANTSVGSRDMLINGAYHSPDPSDPSTSKAIEAYRKRALSIDGGDGGGAEERVTERTPRGNSQTPRQRTQSTPCRAEPSPGAIEGRSSVVRRKPVPVHPDGDENDDSPLASRSDSPPLRMEELQREPSAASASKRALPLDATPRTGSAKRAAMTNEDMSPSPSPTRRRSGVRSPGGPRPVSPFAPRAPATPTAAANGVDGAEVMPTRPLSVRKDGGQAKVGSTTGPTSKEATSARLKKHLDVVQRHRRTNVEVMARLDENLTALRDELLDLDDDSLARRLETIHASVRLVAEQGDEATSSLEKLRLELDALLERDEAQATAASSKREMAEMAEELEKLKARVKAGDCARTELAGLTRRCELLTALEKDGRMENTELHRAFNEELDRLYEDAQHVSGDGDGDGAEEIRRLRQEVKTSKAQRNEANIENKALQRDLALERAQADVYKALLEQHGLA
ncbi:hypothetical protein FA10DRAFT_270161 [Acaromyces ingoldii]|uniref:DH domain-containing protein n=1 Tax=Acaromyces ingoldii TaxID=215250 RepID=A0A316YBE4_9BASI|nr:hypothetical protein FA10DRAFT_270161 [Acaromyces ingoldii]PWN86609.1 hypothetical protein FA10DRAFT_270161 [Acaromyces ingoldii]